MNALLTKSKKNFIKGELVRPANLPKKTKKASLIFVTAEPVQESNVVIKA